MIENLLKKLKNYKINGNHLMIISLLYNGESIKEFAAQYMVKLAEFQYLIRKGYIKMDRGSESFRFETAKLTPLGESVYEAINTVEEVEKNTHNSNELDWIDEWRDLFKDKKPGGAGNKQGCLKKMEIFLKENPTVTKDEIFLATDAYFNSLDNLKYMQQADYFIYKGTGRDSSSRLGQWVEFVREEGITGKVQWHETI